MIGAGTVLDMWERATGMRGAGRTIALTAAVADAPIEDAAALSLGRRDAMLLGLYRDLRGPIVEALATCHACDATLEVQLPIEPLIADYLAKPATDPVVDLDLPSVRVRARLPSTADLLAVADEPDSQTAADALLVRCVLEIRRTDGTATALDEHERAELGAMIERCDPLADTRIDIACAECGEAWQALLDVPELAWSQVHGRARRILLDVDSLAARYGWSEPEILALSDARRAAYLDLG